jgi:hypothetical protein
VGKPDLASDTLNIVLLGEFKPLEVTPRWLRQVDLIGAEDYESCTIEAIGPAATIVGFGSIKMQVTPESLQITTDAAAEVEAARDLVAGILLSNGSHGVSAMGINRHVHFEVDLERYHAIGDTLAPKDPWEAVLYLPGTLSLAITGARDDGYGGSVNVQVQPSTLVRPGVFVSVNDHYTLTYIEVPTDRNASVEPAEANPERTRDKIPTAAKILTENFNSSRRHAQEIIDLIASLGSVSGGSK